MKNVLLSLIIISLFIVSGCTQLSQNENTGIVPFIYRAKVTSILPENLSVGCALNGSVIGWSKTQKTPTDGYIYTHCGSPDDSKVAIIDSGNMSDVKISERSQEYIEKVQLCFSPGFNPQLYNWAIPYVGNEVVSENNCRGEIVRNLGTQQYTGMVYCCMDEAAKGV